jgi:hypothetical protein
MNATMVAARMNDRPMATTMPSAALRSSLSLGS